MFVIAQREIIQDQRRAGFVMKAQREDCKGSGHRAVLVFKIRVPFILFHREPRVLLDFVMDFRIFDGVGEELIHAFFRQPLDR